MSDRYAAERGIPTIPACARSQISLDFDGRCLWMNGPIHWLYAAESGKAGSGGGFEYSPARQREGGLGPIPAGHYWIDPSRMWENHWYNVASRAAWGDHRITIHVFSETQTYGRGGFFIHGGTHAGSAGCINLHGGMEAFAKDLKGATTPLPHCYVPLTVRY